MASIYSKAMLRVSPKTPKIIPLVGPGALHPGRTYATHSSLGSGPSNSSSRKQVTVTNDDGRIRWGELSTREKAARTTQQSFNLFVVVAGIIMTGAVATFLYRDVVSPEGKVNQFNRAVDRVKKDPRCIEVLGDARKIKAYGEPTWNRWARNRPIAARTEKDRTGTEHFYMHFYVEGPLNKGTVNLHMTKRPNEKEFEYRYLALDVKGHQRIYLENVDAQKGDKRASGKMFGVRWW